MGVMRSVFLAASQSVWLREHATRYGFVRRAVSRFMPGETVDDALKAARHLRQDHIRSLLTQLGENVRDAAEADGVARHYLGVLDRIRSAGLDAELSVKLTQLGLDVSRDVAYENLRKIVERAGATSVVWIDMEASNYVDPTLDLYRRARQSYPNVGVCVQAYLYRTARDVETLLPLGAAIRLVKGAYSEPPDRAYPEKKDVDENFFRLAERLLSDDARSHGVRVGVATHDTRLIRRVTEFAKSKQIAADRFEFQMLYGIQRAEQVRLAREGWRSAVLVSYGSYWFSWYMRRLAERPANFWFVLRNLFAV